VPTLYLGQKEHDFTPSKINSEKVHSPYFSLSQLSEASSELILVLQKELQYHQSITMQIMAHSKMYNILTCHYIPYIARVKLFSLHYNFYFVFL
jgi:hypothetical protein